MKLHKCYKYISCVDFKRKRLLIGCWISYGTGKVINLRLEMVLMWVMECCACFALHNDSTTRQIDALTTTWRVISTVTLSSDHPRNFNFLEPRNERQASKLYSRLILDPKLFFLLSCPIQLFSRLIKLLFL